MAQKEIAFIPANKLSTNFNDFGDTYRVVKFERGTDIVLRTDPNPNPALSIKVFFRKNDINIHDYTVTNWFYYWKGAAGSKNLLTSDGIRLYKMNGDIPVLDANQTSVSFSLTYMNKGNYKWIANPPNGTLISYGSTQAGEG